MRVLVSAAWMGGAGGAERALHSVLRALSDDQVDVVVRQRLSGPYAKVGSHVRVFSLFDWQWRWANMRSGLKGSFAQRVINPFRRMILPRYDVYLQFFSGADLNDAVRADVRLLIPSGNEVPSKVASRYDGIAMQAPDNLRFIPEDARTVLLPPPVYDLSDHAECPAGELPERFYLTVFNPYGGVKGTDDLAKVVDEAPHPFVWCHSEATESHAIPEALTDHARITHVVDATPAELRYLYERCEGYVSVSKTEGFGWSIADALRYSPAIFSRRVGVLTFPEADMTSKCEVSEKLQFDWTRKPQSVETADPSACGLHDLDWISPQRFRSTLADQSGRKD